LLLRAAYVFVGRIVGGFFLTLLEYEIAGLLARNARQLLYFAGNASPADASGKLTQRPAIAKLTTSKDFTTIAYPR
jgi:hypothetical protein